jgi:hypothetical protein
MVDDQSGFGVADCRRVAPVKSDGWTIALHWGKSGGWWFRRSYSTVLCMGRFAVTLIPRDLHPLLRDLLVANPDGSLTFEQNLRKVSEARA